MRAGSGWTSGCKRRGNVATKSNSEETSNQMPYYDEELKPWEIVDGQCVVADESEWKRINQINRSAYSNYLDWVDSGGEQPPRPIVKVPTDIFEKYKGGRDENGAMYCSRTGEELSVNQNGHVWPAGWPSMSDGDDWGIRSYTIKDALDRFFQTIDSTPHVDYLIVTRYPERLRELWPVWGCHPDAGDLYCRDNVILAVPVETQNDIERLVPELLKCHDLCKGLAVVCNPKEELSIRPFWCPKCGVSDVVGLRKVKGLPLNYYCDNECCKDSLPVPNINLLIAEGNEHPMHPDHVRSLRDQGKDVVPFHFAGWGDCLPLGQLHAQLHVGITPTPNSTDVYRFPDGRTIRKVGKDKSGRLLDGQEHNGRVS